MFVQFSIPVHDRNPDPKVSLWKEELSYMQRDEVEKSKLSYRPRDVASLTVPSGQEFHFPNFSSNRDFSLKLSSFSSSFWPSGWASRHPGRLWLRYWLGQSQEFWICPPIRDQNRVHFSGDDFPSCKSRLLSPEIWKLISSAIIHGNNWPLQCMLVRREILPYIW